MTKNLIENPNEMFEDLNLISLKDSSKMLGISKRTLVRRIQEGKINFFKDGHLIRIPLAELRRYIKNRIVLNIL